MMPRWLRDWATFTAATTAVLLVLGGVVTTYRVGMADPVWPTVPWYLIFESWSEPEPGFYLEHTHRLFGFIVGGATAVLALGLWWTERGRLRIAGVASVFLLLVLYGQFHRDLMATKQDAHFSWPIVSTTGVITTAALALVAGIVTAVGRTPGGPLRLLGVIALLAVMVQGLLGGVRVRFNELAGTDLALFHGIFGQLVFATLVGLTVLLAKPRPMEALPIGLRSLTGTLLTIAVLQLVWGAMVRHAAGPLSQRLHFLTAFAVVALSVWLLAATFADVAARRRLGVTVVHLGVFILIQITLGVDAWMGRFPPGVDPATVQVTAGKAFIRTAHMTIGTWILATTTIAAILTWAAPRRIVHTETEPRGSLSERARPVGELV